MADSAFPLDAAEIVSLFVESIFYGIYLVSFGACMRVLFSGAGIQSGVNRAMFVVAILMITFATLDLALGLRRVLEAFIWYHGPGGPTAQFEKISSWVQVTRSACYVVQTLIGDLILIYRCFMVYSRRWLVIAPSLTMWAGTLICGSAVIYVSSHLKVSTNLDEKHLAPFLTALLVLTMVQNIVATSLIAYRIRSIDRRMAHLTSISRHSQLQPIVRLIIESGAIYTVSLIIFLVVYVCANNAQYAVSDAIMMIIGIVFNMIIIRVHQGHTAEQQATVAEGVASSSGDPLSFAKTPTDGHATQLVEMNVERQLKQDVDNELDPEFVESFGNLEAKH